MARVAMVLCVAAALAAATGSGASPGSSPAATASAVSIDDFLKPVGLKITTHPRPTTWPAFDPCRLKLTAALGEGAFRHGSEVTCMAVLDGGRVLSAGNDGTIRLWDKDGNLLHRYDSNTEYVWDLLVLPGQEQFISTGGKTAILWDLKTGRRLHEFEHGRMTFRLAADAKFQRLAVTDNSGLTLWDLPGRRKIADLKAADERVFTVVFNADGQPVSGGGDTSIRQWFPGSTQPARFLKEKDKKTKGSGIPPGGSGRITTLAPSPTHDKALVCCATQPWAIDLASGKKLWTAEKSPALLTAAFSPDGATVAGVDDSSACQLHLLDSATGATKWSSELGGRTCYGVAFSPDGKEILCGNENLVCRFDAASGKRLYPAPGQPLRNRSANVGVVPGTDLLLEWERYGGVRLLDRKIGAIKAEYLKDQEIKSASVSADGRCLLAELENGVCVLELASGRQLLRVGKQEEWSQSDCCISPDGSRCMIFSGSEMQVYSLIDGKKLFSQEERSASAVTVGPDGEVALLSSENHHGEKDRLDVTHTVRLVSFAGRLLQELQIKETQARGNYDNDLRNCVFLPGPSPRLLLICGNKLMLCRSDAKEIKKLTAEEVRQAVEQLGANTFQKREEASKLLISGGEDILPALREVRSADPEVMDRLAEVQEKIISRDYKHRCTLTVNEHFASLTVHPAGEYFAAIRGDRPNRQIVFGRLEGDKIALVCQITPEECPENIEFDDRGTLIVGNANGTVNIYETGEGGLTTQPAAIKPPPKKDEEEKPPTPSTTPTTAPTTAPSTQPAGEVFPDYNQKEKEESEPGTRLEDLIIPDRPKPKLQDIFRPFF